MIWSEMSQGWTNMISSTTTRIQELKEERNLLPTCVFALEGMTKIWLETLSLDLDYCRRANNVWYCSWVNQFSKNVSWILNLHDYIHYYYSLLYDF